MKKTLLSIGPLAALLLCGCEVTYKNAGMLVATKVIRATQITAGSFGCQYVTETEELTFGVFNPLGGGYTHGLVIENRLPHNSSLGPGRVNTNDFQIEFAVIDYAQVDGPAVLLPEQTVPGNALIGTGGKGGTRVKTNTYEYVIQADPTFVLGAPVCTAPQAPIACEGVNQDTGTGCAG